MDTSFVSSATIRRPANTTAYTAGDVVGSSVVATAVSSGATQFKNIGPANGHIIITDADLSIYLTSVTASMTSFRLHLYNTSPPSNLADNAVWDLPAADRDAYLGYVDLGTPVDMGSTLFVQTGGVNKKVAMGPSTSLWGYLVTNGGYAPTSGEVLVPRLNAIGA